MRTDLEKIVWAAECHPKVRSWKIVLLNLCHHANPEGAAYPSTGVIAKETGYSRKAVSDALDGLERLEIIRKTGGCGYHNKVTIYSLTGILTAVHNLANCEVTTQLRNLNCEVSSKKSPLNCEVTSPNCEVSSHRSILGRKEVSKLVCTAANCEVTTQFVHNAQKGGEKGEPSVAPPARKEGTPAASGGEGYAQKVRTPGWIPMTDEDRRFCMQHCYEGGASREQAERFIRYNAVRRWTCCSRGGTVNDAVKEWIARWKDESPEEYWAERNRRRANDASKTLN